jgi:hypothetical protein
MNQSEKELRTLIDLALIIQDYQTVVNNVTYPIDDFKKCKAFKYAAHCQELELYAKMVVDREYLTTKFQDFVKQADAIFFTYQKKAVQANKDLVKFCLNITEIYQDLHKHKEASDMFIKLASLNSRGNHISALLYEQAAYEFLEMRQHRKFAYYMKLAANYYSQCKMPEYEVNCLMILHPYYRTFNGWNTIQKEVFSRLAQGNPESSQENAEQYFKDLLRLSHQFVDVNRQKECLKQCVDTFTQMNKGSEGKLNEFNIPLIKAHSIRVFTDSEELTSSNGSKSERSFMSRMARDLNILSIDRKPEMNSNHATWSLMQKALNSYMLKEHQIKTPLSKTSPDELHETDIYDAYTADERQAITKKRVRKVFQSRPITVAFKMKNEMLLEVQI